MQSENSEILRIKLQNLYKDSGQNTPLLFLKFANLIYAFLGISGLFTILTTITKYSTVPFLKFIYYLSTSLGLFFGFSSYILIQLFVPVPFQVVMPIIEPIVNFGPPPAAGELLKFFIVSVIALLAGLIGFRAVRNISRGDRVSYYILLFLTVLVLLTTIENIIFFFNIQPPTDPPKYFVFVLLRSVFPAFFLLAFIRIRKQLKSTSII